VLKPDLIAYFGDDPTRIYQLLQWFPVLERLDSVHRVAIVLREAEAAPIAEQHTTLPVLVAPEFAELVALYEQLAPKVAVYCNNGIRNFQSLLDGRLLHVHINHGESDKQSMVSNNAKAYDRVFVAGEAAVQRHLSGLMEFDPAKLVRIGRPQLDLRPEPLLPDSERRTVLYAPTWEGDAEYNDYTSVDVLGPAIVRSILAVPDVRLVYKPHPKITTSETRAVRDGHRRILAQVADAARRDPRAGHLAVTEGDILAVMPGCDAMVTDVSSVGLDWLYLRTEKPILITDRHHDAERLRQEVPVSRCADVIDSESLGGLTELLAARLDTDEHRIARAAMRHHYFDDVRVGESTDRFIAEIGALVALRDRLVGLDPALDEGVVSA
jgi:hypothetical protein